MKKLTASLRRQWQAFRFWWRRRSRLIRNYFIVVGLLLSFLTVYFWPWLNDRVFLSLRPGEAGVLWERFFGGTNLNWTYREGFHFVLPWDRMYVYNVRLQQTPHKIVALCKNGLPVELEVSIRHRPLDGKLPLLHEVVGPDYVNVVIKPEIEAHVRAVVSQFEPAELYTSEGYIINLIVQGAASAIAERYISLDDLLIKRIILPPKVADAIEAKLIQEQRLFTYDFLIGQARKEAERKGIEASGILEFQKTVAAGGSFRDYLRYAGIQATVDLAQSTNAKMVVVGNSDGLPLILNMPEDSNHTGPATAPTALLPRHSPPQSSTPPPLGGNPPATTLAPESSAPPSSSPESSAPPSHTPESSAPPATVPANSSSSAASAKPTTETPTTPPTAGTPDAHPASARGTNAGKP